MSLIRRTAGRRAPETIIIGPFDSPIPRYAWHRPAWSYDVSTSGLKAYQPRERAGEGAAIRDEFRWPDGTDAVAKWGIIWLAPEWPGMRDWEFYRRGGYRVDLRKLDPLSLRLSGGVQGHLWHLGGILVEALQLPAAKGRRARPVGGEVSGGLLPEEREAFPALLAEFRHWAQHVHGDGIGPEEAAEWNSAHRRFRLIGLGGARAVFALPHERVLKAGFRPRCMSNRTEIAVWRTAPPAVRRHLEPVLAAAPDGDWLVMRRRAVRDERAEVPHEAAAVLGAWGIQDFKPDAFTRGGKMLDYGMVSFAREDWLGREDPSSGLG